MAEDVERWHVVATVAVLGGATLASLVGFVRSGHYRASADLVRAYQIQDATILAVGVPVVAVGCWYALRGSQRGRLVWLGGLAFMTYIWASVAIQVPFNELFLLYVGLFSLSLFTFVGVLVTTDPDAVADTLDGRINTSLFAGALTVIGVGLATLWLSDIVPPLLTGTTPRVVEEAGAQAIASHVIDLGVVVPAIVLSAALLSRQRPWGYVFAGVVLVLGAALGAPIGLMTIVLMTGETVTVSPIAAVFSFLPIIVAALLAVQYLRAMQPRPQRSSDTEPSQST